MLKTVVSIAAATFVVATAVLTGPAAATTTGQAVGICLSRGPDCTTTNKGDHLQLCVNNDGKQQCVNCPNVGESGNCSVAQSAGQGSKINVLGVGAILQGAKKAPPTGKKGLGTSPPAAKQ